jgi:hypothetical protein
MDTEEPQTVILKDLNYDEDLTINKMEVLNWKIK